MRAISFKVESEKGAEEYTVKVTKKEWQDIIWYLTDEKGFNSKISRKIISTSSDEALVVNAITNYEGNLSTWVLKSIIKKFPKSKDIQHAIITYCEGMGKPDTLRYLNENGINKKIRKEAKEAFELLTQMSCF